MPSPKKLRAAALAIAALFLLSNRSESQDVKWLTMQFQPGSATSNGYAGAALNLRYRFDYCAAMVQVIVWVLPQPASVTYDYWYNGRLWTNYDGGGVSQPTIGEGFSFRGIVGGALNKRISGMVVTNENASCFNQGNSVAEGKELWPANASDDQRRAVLQQLSLQIESPTARPPLRNSALESVLYRLAEQEKAQQRKAEQERLDRENAAKAAAAARAPAASAGAPAAASAPAASTSRTGGSSSGASTAAPARDNTAEREAARKAEQQRTYDSTMAAITAQQAASQRKVDRVVTGVETGVALFGGYLRKRQADKERREAEAEAQRSEQDARIANEIERRVAPHRAAAEAGDADAQYQLYEAYNDGRAALGNTYRGNDAHLKLAGYWLERAAIQGHRSAQTHMGDGLISGYYGMTQDYARGIEFSNAAYAKGAYLQPRHVHGIMNVLWSGPGIARNVEESKRWSLAYLIATTGYYPGDRSWLAVMDMIGSRFPCLSQSVKNARLAQTATSVDERRGAVAALAARAAVARNPASSGAQVCDEVRVARANMERMVAASIDITPMLASDQEARIQYSTDLVDRALASVIPDGYGLVLNENGKPLWVATGVDTTTLPVLDGSAADLTEAAIGQIRQLATRSEMYVASRIGYVELSRMRAVFDSFGVRPSERVKIMTSTIESVRQARNLLYIFDDQNRLLAASAPNVAAIPPASRSNDSPNITSEVSAALVKSLTPAPPASYPAWSAEELDSLAMAAMADMKEFRWAAQVAEKNGGRKPIVRVRTIVNKGSTPFDEAGLVSRLNDSFSRSSDIELAKPNGNADFILTGSIESISEENFSEKRADITYQVSLKLISVETGKVSWMGVFVRKKTGSWK